MRLRTLAAAATLAVLLPGLATTSAHADAPTSAHRAAKVTLKDLPASSEVGQKVTIAGTAKLARKGKRVKRVKVTVERSYGGGRWQKVATTRTNKRGKYAVKVALTQGGPTSFRVKRAGGGTSRADSLAVYEWLDLAAQPFVFGANIGQSRVTTVVGGRALPESIETSGDGNLFWSVAACTTVRVWTGFRDADRGQLEDGVTQSLAVRLMDGKDPDPDPVASYTTPVGPAVLRTIGLTSAKPYLYLLVDGPGTSVLGTPQARCNAARLPAVRYQDIFGNPA